MARHLSTVILAAVVLALISACAKQEPNVVGFWSTTGLASTTLKVNGTDARLPNRTELFLKLKADKTFYQDLYYTFVEGTWTQKGNEITFTPTVVNGTSVEQYKLQLKAAAREDEQALVPGLNGPQEATLSEDHQTLTLAAFGSSFDFHPTKEPSPPPR